MFPIGGKGPIFRIIHSCQAILTIAHHLYQKQRASFVVTGIDKDTVASIGEYVQICAIGRHKQILGDVYEGQCWHSIFVTRRVTYRHHIFEDENAGFCVATEAGNHFVIPCQRISMSPIRGYHHVHHIVHAFGAMVGGCQRPFIVWIGVGFRLQWRRFPPNMVHPAAIFTGDVV